MLHKSQFVGLNEEKKEREMKAYKRQIKWIQTNNLVEAVAGDVRVEVSVL